jgi:Fur family transcriptional regulator, peroxide stress response regulator
VGALRRLGLKVTPQRLSILQALEGDRTHPSAETIYQKVSRQFPGMSFATVYNTLSALLAAGKIQGLDIDPRQKRYDPYTDKHDHFFCRICRKVYDLDSTAPLAAEIRKIDGHQVEEVQIQFKGTCKTCRTHQTVENTIPSKMPNRKRTFRR